MPYLFTYILADDDAMYREYTIQQLNTIPNLKCLAVCDSAIATRNMLQEHTPDFLVLDVEMPGLTGIQLAKSLKNLPLTIFITSHPNYAVDAFELDAVDYLVKPAAPERLLRAIDKVKMLLQIKHNATSEDSFKIEDKDSFFIKDKGAFIKINCADVLYAESLGDFVTIFLQNGEKKIALVSMKNFEQQLPSSLFIRISRTHLVNKQKVTTIEHNMVHINNIKLHIGTTYIDVVMQNIVGDSAIKRFI
jgi:two-component system, LytTR family, response regulator